MKRVLLLIGFVAAALPLDAKKFFYYDVRTDFQFDNREFDRGGNAFTPSQTLSMVTLTPTVGISIMDKKKIRHRVLAGLDICKELGANPVTLPGAPDSETDAGLENRRLLREITLYYQLNARVGRNRIRAVAGVYPRFLVEGEYGRAFFSDSLRMYDPNLEGVLLQWVRPRSFYEIGADWMGKAGQYRKERFMLFGHAVSHLRRWLEVGGNFMFYHYAGSKVARYVVDNHLAEAFVRSDIGYKAGIQQLSLKLGWLQGLQNDRYFVGKNLFPGVAEAVASVRHWNVGLTNELYWGTSLMPYFNHHDTGGFLYGSSLYPGDPFFRMSPKADGADDSWRKRRFYDRVELYWQPRISPMLDLRLSVDAHFAGGYQGCTQKISLIFDLFRRPLRPSDATFGKTKRSYGSRHSISL